MKTYSVMAVIIALVMLFAPLAAVAVNGSRESESVTSDETVTAEQTASKHGFDDKIDEKVLNTDFSVISVFNPSDESVSDMSMRDYCIGAVAAEMPASYGIEALKAQALVCITYAEAMKLKKDPSQIGGADIAADSSRHQGFITVDEMKAKWGDGFDEYYKKISDAVDAVIDYHILYEHEPIVAAFHAISSGKTESALNMWGSDIPYLQSVESEDDKLSPRYSTTVTFSSEQFREITEKNGCTQYGDNGDSWIGEPERSDSGTVLKQTICGKEFTGTEIRSMFSLSSPAFEVSYDNGYFTFKSYGYGHGVGMSQYGADRMAQNGAKYSEIIMHYYKGVSIVKK